MALNGHNAALAPPVSDSVAEHSASHENALECESAATPGGRDSSVLTDGRIDNLHEQLAALVEALSSEHDRQPQVDEEACYDDPADPSAVFSAEHHDWATRPDPAPVAAPENVHSRRLLGFIAGFIASIAVGGGLLMFAASMSKPTAIAGNAAPEVESPVAAITAAPEQSPELPLEARLPHAFGIEPEASVGAQKGQYGASENKTVNIAARPDEGGAGTASLVEPGAEPHASRDRPVVGPSDPHVAAEATSAASGLAAPGQTENQFEPRPSRESTAFETVVRPANEESAPSLPQVAAKLPTAHNPEEATSAPTRVTHVIRAVNMRAGPANGAEVLAIVSEGSPVEVIQCTQWCEVIFAGQRGWIYRSFMADAGTDEGSVRYN